MSHMIQFARVIQGELPFTLNLPDDTYAVLVDGAIYVIDVLQNRFAAADGPTLMISGTREELREHFGDRLEQVYRHDLHTIVRHREEVSVDYDALPAPDDAQMFDAAQTHLIRATPGIIPGGAEQLQLQTRLWLDGLDETERQQFSIDTQLRRAAKAAFPNRDSDAFCNAVNVLIRSYMTTFNDRFVEEVCESMFSQTAFKGIHAATLCNSQPLDTLRLAGGFVPFLRKGPWFDHPPETVEQFRLTLQHSPEPDAVALLGVRAQSMLLRGAHRSAIVEASAALDLSLSRKIRAGLRQLGQQDADIEAVLRSPKNQRFDVRAKTLLREATGKSAAEFDNQLWERVGNQRATYRQGVTHADREPSRKEAESVVTDFLRLVELI